MSEFLQRGRARSTCAPPPSSSCPRSVWPRVSLSLCGAHLPVCLIARGGAGEGEPWACRSVSLSLYLPVPLPTFYLSFLVCTRISQICSFPSFRLSVIPSATGPQWGAAYSLPFPTVTIAFCHPSDGMSLPLSYEDRPSRGDRLSPLAPQHLSSHAPGSCPPFLFLTFLDAPSTWRCLPSSTGPSGKNGEWKQWTAG